jgi:hypothetical protein
MQSAGMNWQGKSVSGWNGTQSEGASECRKIEGKQGGEQIAIDAGG